MLNEVEVRKILVILITLVRETILSHRVETKTKCKGLANTDRKE